MSENKRIAKNTLFLYLRMLLTMVVSLYTSRIVLAKLGVADYGTYNVVGGVVAVFTFLNSSMGGATSRFLTFALGKDDKIELQKTFSATLTIHILIAFIILILAETVGLWFLENKLVIAPERMNAARIVYQLSIISTMITIAQVPYNATIIAHERMNIYAYVEILNTFLKLGIVYLLIVGNWDKMVLFALLTLIVSIIISAVYMLYCVNKFEESKYKFEWDKKIIYPILSFSVWNMVGCGAVAGATQGVNILLNLFFGAVVNAARGVAVQVNGTITAFVNNFQTAVNPQIVKLYAAGKMNELFTLVFQNAKFSFSIMWLLLLPISLKMETILHIWLVEVPEYTALFCRLVLIQSLISCVQRPFVMAIHAMGRIKVLQLTAGTILLSVLPISYFFLKAGGQPYIPFAVYILCTMLEFSCEIYLLKRWINLSIISLFKTVFLPQALIILCTLPFSLLVSHYTNFIFTTLFSALSVCLSVYFITFNKETRIKLIYQLKNIIKNKYYGNKIN